MVCQTLTFSSYLPKGLEVKTEDEAVALMTRIVEIKDGEKMTEEEKRIHAFLEDVKDSSNNFTILLSDNEIEKIAKEHEEKIKAEEERKKARRVALCSTSSIKTYMDGKKITNRATKAYQLISQMEISEDGFYKQDKYYAVALGNYYGPDGTKYKITLDTGRTFYAIKTDTKSDAHTYNRCTHISDGSMIEFIIDVPTATKYYGKVGLTGNFNAIDKFNGRVAKMELIID